MTSLSLLACFAAGPETSRGESAQSLLQARRREAHPLLGVKSGSAVSGKSLRRASASVRPRVSVQSTLFRLSRQKIFTVSGPWCRCRRASRAISCSVPSLHPGSRWLLPTGAALFQSGALPPDAAAQPILPQNGGALSAGVFLVNRGAMAGSLALNPLTVPGTSEAGANEKANKQRNTESGKQPVEARKRESGTGP
jgi:hypothetical protein